MDFYFVCFWIFVCTSISKCQYNFQFLYDFRPFLLLSLTAFFPIFALFLSLKLYFLSSLQRYFHFYFSLYLCHFALAFYFVIYLILFGFCFVGQRTILFYLSLFILFLYFRAQSFIFCFRRFICCFPYELGYFASCYFFSLNILHKCSIILKQIEAFKRELITFCFILTMSITQYNLVRPIAELEIISRAILIQNNDINRQLLII